MSAHTQGRLVAYGRVIRGDENTSEDQVAEATYSEADARRLAACWNHCDGIDTDTMEAGRPMLERVGLYIKEADQLRAEVVGVRAALAAARGERDELRTELDKVAALSEQRRLHSQSQERDLMDACGRRDDMIAHGQAKALELAEAMALLAEVHSFATGAPSPIGSAGCHALAQLGERVGAFLKGGA